MSLLSARGSAAAVASTSARGSATVVPACSPARSAKQQVAASRSLPTLANRRPLLRTTSTTTATAALDSDTVLSAAAASADATAPIYDINDPVVTAVFTLATIALSILTLGVAYLSLTGWIDSRNEEAERKRVEAAERSR